MINNTIPSIIAHTHTTLCVCVVYAYARRLVANVGGIPKNTIDKQPILSYTKSVMNIVLESPVIHKSIRMTFAYEVTPHVILTGRLEKRISTMNGTQYIFDWLTCNKKWDHFDKTTQQILSETIMNSAKPHLDANLPG